MPSLNPCQTIFSNLLKKMTERHIEKRFLFLHNVRKLLRNCHVFVNSIFKFMHAITVDYNAPAMINFYIM